VLTTSVVGLLTRELRTMQRELEAYPDERQIWESHPALPNSAGTLALHAAGNLQHFIGAVLGKNGYVRNRDAEFSRRDVPRAELVQELGAAIDAVERWLPQVTESALADWYPLAVANRRIRTQEFILHLATHLSYHLGQLDYHRRLVTGDATGSGAVSPAELPSAIPIDG
jgi:uncharacterized damage-inducible protein DinB